MIAARRHDGFVAAFGAYVRWLLRQSFRGVWIRHDAAFPRSGFVAIANHTSWWDGFVPFAVQRALAPERPFYVMMTQEQLQRFWFFRYAGAFAIDASTPRRAYAAVRHAADLARDGAGVWIFPQGRIEPPNAMLAFARGAARAAALAGVPLVPCALRFAMLEAQRPDAFLEIGSAIDPVTRAAVASSRATTMALLSRVDRQIASGRALLARRSIVAGARGVDDVTSRLAAPLGKWLAGS